MSLTPAQTQFLQSAVAPAQASQADFQVPAAVTMAQAILESGWGAQHIGDANNYFGIKANKKPDGTVDYGSIATSYVEVPTREVINGQSVMVNALFRSYASMTDSFRDHGQFLQANSRYASAFQTTDSNEFARRIAAAGYATDPNYASVLISLMTSNNLYQYNQAGSGSGDAGTGDAGTPTDGGSASDGGTDSGSSTDRGSGDAGTGDSGSSSDGGSDSSTDGGTSSDSGSGGSDSGSGDASDGGSSSTSGDRGSEGGASSNSG